MLIHLTEDEKKMEFVSFCIEEFKVRHQINGGAVAELFDQTGVLDFLLEGWDVLHTQGKDYVQETIERFLRKEKEKIS